MARFDWKKSKVPRELCCPLVCRFPQTSLQQTFANRFASRITLSSLIGSLHPRQHPELFSLHKYHLNLQVFPRIRNPNFANSIPCSLQFLIEFPQSMAFRSQILLFLIVFLAVGSANAKVSSETLNPSAPKAISVRIPNSCCKNLLFFFVPLFEA